MLNDYCITLLQFILPKKALTVLIACFANARTTWLKNFLIKHFIRAYRVNMFEAHESDATAYPTFNDFFIRKLKKSARPKSKAAWICPVDGTISETGIIHHSTLLQAKGRTYTVSDLFGGKTSLFEQGTFTTFYLAPKDYHRIHMPIEGLVTEMIYLPGQLFSVQPATTRLIPKLFAKNERVVIFFETKKGPMAMVLVGALIVGKIATTWHGEFKRQDEKTVFSYDNPIPLKQGEELGYFKLGSTVILITAQASPLHVKAGDTVKLYMAIRAARVSKRTNNLSRT